VAMLDQMFPATFGGGPPVTPIPTEEPQAPPLGMLQRLMQALARQQGGGAAFPNGDSALAGAENFIGSAASPIAAAAAATPQAPELAPVLNDPAANQPEVFADGVPLPRPRPPGTLDSPIPGERASEREPAAPLSMAAGSPAEMGAPAPAERSSGIGNVLGKIFNPNNAATLLALGGGFAGAPSFGTGMRRAFTQAAPAVAQANALNLKLSTMGETYRALIAKGVPPAEALAAATNPDIMKATAAKYFEAKARVPHEIGQDTLGNKIMGSFDPNTGKYYDVTGREVKGDGSSVGGVMGGGALFAKGVTQYNPDLPEDEYLNQFSPDVQAAIKNYVRGDTMPTSNPRMKGFETKVKEWARLYGDKKGIEVSDAKFGERREMRNQLSRATPASMGGQINFGGTSLGHLGEVAEKTVALGNVGGLGIGPIAHAANWVRGLSTAQEKAVKDAQAAVQHYGQEITKFYTGSPGGVEERARFMKTMDTLSSPEAISGAIRAERDLIPHRLEQLHAQIEKTLGKEEADKHIAKANLPAAIERINRALAKLDPKGPEALALKTGGAPAAAAPHGSPAAPTPPDGFVPTTRPAPAVAGPARAGATPPLPPGFELVR
jgi:hypothetical protein